MLRTTETDLALPDRFSYSFSVFILSQIGFAMLWKFFRRPSTTSNYIACTRFVDATDCIHTIVIAPSTVTNAALCSHHKLQPDGRHSTFYSREYCTLQPTTFGLKIYRGDVKKWSRGHIEPDYRQTPLPVAIQPAAVLYTLQIAVKRWPQQLVTTKSHALSIWTMLSDEAWRQQ